MGNRRRVMGAIVVGALAVSLFCASVATAGPFDPKGDKGGRMESASGVSAQEARDAGVRPAAVQFDDGVAYSTRLFQNGGGRLQFGSVLCPRRWEVLGGGVETGSGNQFVNATHPFDTRDGGGAPDDGWRAWVRNAGSDAALVSITAICLR